MLKAKSQVSLLLFYIAVASITTFIHVLPSFIVLLLMSWGKGSLQIGMFYIVLLFVLAYGPLGGSAIWLYTWWSGNPTMGLRIIGVMVGRTSSLILGAILGFAIANWVGLIVGALSFYFLGWWSGQKLSIRIGDRIERFFPSARGIEETSHPIQRHFLIGLSVILPVLFVVIALLLNYYKIRIASLSDWLPVLRPVAVVVSLWYVSFPWRSEKRLLVTMRAKPSKFLMNPEFIMFYV